VRTAVIVAGSVLLVLLGALQGFATVLLRNSAEPGAWSLRLPPALAARVESFETNLPLPPALRIVQARRALEAHQYDLAARRIARLPAGSDRAALAGRLSEERGDETTAVRDYLEAGDLNGLERRTDRLEEAGDIAGALALQRATVDRLAGDFTQGDALAQAYYRLGRLEQATAYGLTLGSQARHNEELRSYAAYNSAVALAPFAERYLIAAGNQELNLGELERAREFFKRAQGADPTSVQALVGYGDIAFRAGDVVTARSWLARARRIDPKADAVERLAHKLGDE